MPKRFVDSGLSSPWCLVFLISLIWVLRAPALAQLKPPVDLSGKNILVLHAFEGNTPVFLGTDKGLSNTLLSAGIPSVNQFYESLDLRRNPGAEHRKLLVEQMRIRYGHRKSDLIVTMYPEAMEFVLKDGRDIFPDVPILALYLPEGFELPKTDRRIIGHSAKLDIIGTLEIARKLVPGAKRVYVVSGVHEVDKKYEDQARRDLKKWEGRLEFHYLSHMSLEDMFATLSIATPDSIILALIHSQDVTGRSYTSPAVAQRLSQVSTAPIFGLLDAALGHGIAGGSLLNFERIGTKAGQLTLDILRGTKIPENIPNVLDVPPLPMFDWAELRRWKLSEAALPKGSIIINRETTFWDYKYYIIGGFVVSLAQTILVIGLLVQRRRKAVAEESLRQKTEELDQFFDVTLDLLGIANTDGYFLRLNPAVERSLGYTREELMARPFFEFVHPDDLDRTQEAVSTLASQQKIASFENRYRCKDGTYRWLQWSSAPVGKLIYAAARDVTEKKRGEEALEERLRFEELLSNISSRFVNIPPDRVDPEIRQSLKQIIDFFKVDRCALLQTLAHKTLWKITHVVATEGVPPVPQGTELPISINPWAYDKLIRKQEVLSFSRIDDLPAEANVDKQTWNEWGIRSNLNIPIILGGPVHHVFAINSVKSERVWLEESIPRLRLLGEIFVNALERKRAEQEAYDSRRELTRMERLSRMGELSASLSHELNQPLTAILSNANAALRFLEAGKLDPAELIEILQDIVKDDKRAGNIIRNLRAMVKPEEGERELISINGVLRETVALFRSEAIIRNVKIEMDLAHPLPPLYVTKVQIQQVLLNLMMNAAESMTRDEFTEKVIVLQTAASGEGVVKVAVRDFGPGVEGQALQRIFEPFFTMKRSGLGMGLSLSRSIIESHGGHIWAENNPDKGITFYFDLPGRREE